VARGIHSKQTAYLACKHVTRPVDSVCLLPAVCCVDVMCIVHCTLTNSGDSCVCSILTHSRPTVQYDTDVIDTTKSAQLYSKFLNTFKLSCFIPVLFISYLRTVMIEASLDYEVILYSYLYLIYPVCDICTCRRN